MLELRQLVAERGEKTVWFAGILALGYPPTWQISLGDLIRVQKFLDRYFIF